MRRPRKARQKKVRAQRILISAEAGVINAFLTGSRSEPAWDALKTPVARPFPSQN